MLDLNFEPLSNPIHHSDPILLMGSCFTGNIGTALDRLFFNTVANPTGILFDPDSIVRHLEMAMNDTVIIPDDLIYFEEKYQHTEFHSDFSSTELAEAVQRQNDALIKLRASLSAARYLIITIGSSYAYRYKTNGNLVANCHQFPGTQFDKELLSTEYTFRRFASIIDRLEQYHPELQIIFTVSPVRHIRDGVVANNRSKARLLEAVHLLSEHYNQVNYFPAYEWIIDVLRDYRYYDVDLVHPNYAATESVFEQFCAACMDEYTRNALKKLRQLDLALHHKARFPDTSAHKKFLKNRDLLLQEIKGEMPWINFEKN